MPTSSCLSAGSAIHTVTGHSHDVAVLLQYFYNGVFVFRENLSEAVGLVDLLGSVQWDLPFSNITGEEPSRRLDICAISSSEGICRAIATLSPVTIFTFTP